MATVHRPAPATLTPFAWKRAFFGKTELPGERISSAAFFPPPPKVSPPAKHNAIRSASCSRLIRFRAENELKNKRRLRDVSHVVRKRFWIDALKFHSPLPIVALEAGTVGRIPLDFDFGATNAGDGAMMAANRRW